MRQQAAYKRLGDLQDAVEKKQEGPIQGAIEPVVVVFGVCVCSVGVFFFLWEGSLSTIFALFWRGGATFCLPFNITFQKSGSPEPHTAWDHGGFFSVQTF